MTEIGEDASTQTGGLALIEFEGLDKELRMISSSLKSAIAKLIAKQVDIDKKIENLRKWQMMKHIRTSKEKKCE